LTETFREAIEAAERAVVGRAEHDLETVARLVDGLEATLPGTYAARAYLAVLVDWLGLRDHATRILRWTDSRNAQANGAEGAALRNLEGMLAANHGQFGRAMHLFEEALAIVPEGTPLRTKILANLAAASLRAGRMTSAADWVAEASEADRQTRDPAVEALLASVNACMALRPWRTHQGQGLLNSALIIPGP
jgi:Tfp pilus assembly protein PilF